MIPSFLKGKIEQPTNAFTSDDELSEEDRNNNKRKLVDMLQNQSSSAVSKLITKNKERKEKEEQAKKKQKFVKESNAMKEIEERIHMIATSSSSSSNNNNSIIDDNDEWEEFTQETAVESDHHEDDDDIMREEETTTTASSSSTLPDEQDDSLHITIKNEDSNEFIDSSSKDPSKKKVVNRKSKHEHRLISVMNLTHLMLYFNFYYLLNEYISSMWECEEVKGHVLSLLLPFTQNSSSTSSSSSSSNGTSNTSIHPQNKTRTTKKNTKSTTNPTLTTIDACVEWVYETFTFHKFKKHSFYKILVDEKDEISQHLKNLEIHNICELYIVVMLVLIYSGYTVRFVASLELPSLLEKKKKKKKHEHFEHDIWLEVNDPKEQPHETRVHYTTIELNQKEPNIENTTLNIEGVEKLYKKMSKTSCEYPIVVVSFDYLGGNVHDSDMSNDHSNTNRNIGSIGSIGSLGSIGDNSIGSSSNDHHHDTNNNNNNSGHNSHHHDHSNTLNDTLSTRSSPLHLFHYIIRDVTPKHYICKHPSTLIGKENYQYVENAMKELIHEINEKNYLKHLKCSRTHPSIHEVEHSSTIMNPLVDASSTTIESSSVNTNTDPRNSKHNTNNTAINTITQTPKDPTLVITIEDDKTEDLMQDDVILIHAQQPPPMNESNGIESTPRNIDYSKITNPFIEKDSLLIQSILTQMELEVPSSIQDFQTHPIYIIEKFIPKYEGIYPKDIEPVCVVKSHNVYLRSSLKPLHTKDRWLRDEMKKVKENEKPYKIVKAAKFSKNSEYTELFGEWQTEPYSVPVVTMNDPIPKSEKGTYELWNSNFLPQGCSHISTANTPLKGLTTVARKLEIDYARAMVGFEFRQKRSVPKYDGIIVHSENEQVLREAYVAYEKKRLEKLKKKRQDRIMNNWCKLVRGLLAREYVKDKYLNKKEEVFLRDVITVDEEMCNENGRNIMCNENSVGNDSSLTLNEGSASSSTSPPKVQRMLASGKIVEFEQL
ncbi:hypothetical protein C9374_011330 [Naegleria lovaniensis]|uniref:Uncharacterized protein n=1 Tax=Naegleria lovaniensis TaxID=51637 RepID=A0AA88KWK1_NAELO|nr:uncharacterized protein C9374_011330 [Naegleria lovaniensis]KAG2392605.1 hypothetical protein C9374_011330 [Naegleria lovaniensis]